MGGLVENLGFGVAVVHGMGSLMENLGFRAVVVHGMDNLVENLGLERKMSTGWAWWTLYMCWIQWQG